MVKLHPSRVKQQQTRQRKPLSLPLANRVGVSADLPGSLLMLMLLLLLLMLMLVLLLQILVLDAPRPAPASGEVLHHNPGLALRHPAPRVTSGTRCGALGVG